MATPDPDPSGERMRFEQVAHLYMVVQGRPPDPGGLHAYMGQLREGRTLPDLAGEFVASGEFRGRVGDGDPRALLLRHALGPDAPPPPEAAEPTLAGLAAALVLSPAVRDRLPILPAMYPDGVPWTPADYRIWLLGRPAPAPGPTPGVSIVMLPDRPRWRELAAAVRAVLALGDGVELVIALPLPSSRRAIPRDPRIRVVWCAPWSGRAARFDRALHRCRGAFVALIGQHDQVDPALAAFAPPDGAEIVVADDDHLTAEGLREAPRLGTDWDPDRVLAAGCPGLVLLRTTLARRIGGMGPAAGRPTAGREEWAMLLAAAAAVPEAAIHHWPAIALARREQERADAAPPDLAVATRFLRATGRQADAVIEGTRLRVLDPLPQPAPLVSVIIPTKDRAELLRRCMEGLLHRTDYPALEILVVDNGSTAPDALALLAELARDARVRVLPCPGPFNWSALNNAGVAAMRGEVAVLLNNDTDVIDPGWLRELAAQALRPEVGIAGAKLLYGDGRVQHAGVVLGPQGRGSHMWRFLPGDAPGYLDQLVVTRRVTALTGACVAIRRTVYEAAGGCDAEHLAVTWNDVDLCLRVRALGLLAVWTPHARLLHLEQASRGSDDTPENQRRFLREQAWMRHRWGGALDRDPFRNPNLLPSEAEMRLTSRFD